MSNDPKNALAAVMWWDGGERAITAREKALIEEHSPSSFAIPLIPAPTPGARWAADGQSDPHSRQYECERSALTLGHYTDDELANAVFLHGNEQPSMAALAAGKALPGIAYLTAAKDRIRWLSRSLSNAIASSRPLEQEPVKPVGCGQCPVTGLPFYDNMVHPERGMIAMYGGPFDVFSVPELQVNDGELRRERYDLDADAWVEGGEPLGYFYSEQQPEAAAPAEGVGPSHIATRKLEELAGQGYVTNGVAIFNPATGQRGLVDNLGYVGWQGAQVVDLAPLRVLVAAVEEEFCCEGTEANEPDDSKVSYPEETCPITFGMIRAARRAIDGRDAGMGVDRG